MYIQFNSIHHLQDANLLQGANIVSVLQYSRIGVVQQHEIDSFVIKHQIDSAVHALSRVQGGMSITHSSSSLVINYTLKNVIINPSQLPKNNKTINNIHPHRRFSCGRRFSSGLINAIFMYLTNVLSTCPTNITSLFRYLKKKNVRADVRRAKSHL